MGAWRIVKDISHTVMGLALIASQGPWFTHSPSGLLLGGGLTLCGVNLAEHAASALGGGDGKGPTDGT